MPNRFIRLIEDGVIATEPELKSAFRALALATHPDVGAEPGQGEAFIRARLEYEAARRYLAPKDPGRRSASGRFDRSAFYADLAEFLKAGFPKRPRHDKERSKYAKLRVRVRSSLAAYEGAAHGAPLAAFDAFEAELLARKDDATIANEEGLAEIYALLDALVEYEECGIVPLRAAIEIEFAAIRAKAWPASLLGFLTFLVGDMEGGPALG